MSVIDLAYMWRVRDGVRWGFAVGAIAAVLAGCGSSSNSGVTKAQYVAKADAICKAAAAQTGPIVGRIIAAGPALASANAKTAKEIAPLVGRLHEQAASSLAQLRALKEPNADHSGIERFLSPLTNVVGAVGQAASTLRAGQGSAALGLLAQVQPEAQQAASAAQAYGVGPCGSVLSALG